MQEDISRQRGKLIEQLVAQVLRVWFTQGMAKGVKAEGMPERQLKGITEVVRMLTTMRLEMQEVE